MNKRGESTGTPVWLIVTIILALIVLVFMVFGTGEALGDLWSKVAGFGSGKVNVQTVVQSCQVACSVDGTYDYCRKLRSVVFENEGDKYKLTCSMLEKPSVEFSVKEDNTDKIRKITIPSSGIVNCEAIDESRCNTLTDQARLSEEFVTAANKIKSITDVPPPTP